jgi:hypothetical protein
MTGVKRLIKSYRLVNNSGVNAAVPVLAIFFVVLSFLICAINTAFIIGYFKQGIFFPFSSYIMFIFCGFSFSSSLIIYFINANVKNHNTFLIQLPINKKTLFNFKFFIVMLGTLVLHVQMLYYVLLNYLTDRNVYITDYIGFSIIVYCLWFMGLCAAIGFSNLPSTKVQSASWFSTITGVLVLIIMVWSLITDRHAMIKDYDMYNALGKGFAPILKASGIFGGFGGLLLLAASIAIGYYLCVTLPLKVSEREG